MTMHTPSSLSRTRQRVTRGAPQPSPVQQALACTQDRRRLHEALSHWQQAYQTNPLDENIVLGYARALFRQGRMDEALNVFQQGLRELPDTTTLSYAYLWHLHYLPGPDRALFYKAYCDLGRQWTQGFSGLRQDTPRSLHRPLRIGILAGDFLANAPIGHFASVWQACDSERVTLVGYNNASKPDEATVQWEAVFDAFAHVHDLSDAELAALIERERIDILVAFGGLCQDHRIGVMRYRPADLQVDMGSISTLGLPQVDLRISDAVLDPPTSQAWSVERLAYMPSGFVTYQPPAESPLINPLPALQRGYLTFGSFNNQRKLNDTVLAWWGEIFQALPTARLLMKFPDADDPQLRSEMLRRLTAQGISAERVEIWGGTTHRQHLELLQSTDLLLDSYPFTGFRTTLEGLWMGVPTITRMGDLFVARMGAAALKQLNLEAFVADSAEAYVAKARAFAEQLTELARLRETLRGWLLNSSVCDPKRYADEWVTLLEQCWQEGQGGDD